MEEINELYWLPMPEYANGGETRELTIWQTEDGLFGYCWKNRTEYEGFVDVDAARSAALADAATRWDGLTKIEG